MMMCLHCSGANREGKSGGCLTVATYNVHHFGNEITGYSCKEIARYMQQRHVDVLCFQEFGDNPHFTTDSLRRALSHWPYALFLRKTPFAAFSPLPYSAATRLREDVSSPTHEAPIAAWRATLFWVQTPSAC
mgnify:CR=1 FL=1